MTLDDYVALEKEGLEVGGLSQELTKEAKRKNNRDTVLAEIARKIGGDEELARYVNVDDPNEVAAFVSNYAADRMQRAKGLFKDKKKGILGEIPDARLVEDSTGVKPYKTGEAEHDSHYDAHLEAYNTLKVLSNPDSKEARKLASELIERYISERAEKKAEEKRGEIKKRLVGNGDETNKYLSEEIVGRWVDAIVSLEKRRAASELSEEFRDNPKKASDEYLDFVRKKFYDTFGKHSREKAIAEYTRDNLSAASEESDEGLNEVRKYVLNSAERE